MNFFRSQRCWCVSTIGRGRLYSCRAAARAAVPAAAERKLWWFIAVALGGTGGDCTPAARKGEGEGSAVCCDAGARSGTGGRSRGVKVARSAGAFAANGRPHRTRSPPAFASRVTREPLAPAATAAHRTVFASAVPSRSSSHTARRPRRVSPAGGTAEVRACSAAPPVRPRACSAEVVFSQRRPQVRPRPPPRGGPARGPGGGGPRAGPPRGGGRGEPAGGPAKDDLGRAARAAGRAAQQVELRRPAGRRDPPRPAGGVAAGAARDRGGEEGPWAAGPGRAARG